MDVVLTTQCQCRTNELTEQELVDYPEFQAALSCFTPGKVYPVDIVKIQSVTPEDRMAQVVESNSFKPIFPMKLFVKHFKIISGKETI